MSQPSETRGVAVRYVTPEHVAALTPFEPVTIRRACARGEIPGAVKKAGRWCIPEGAQLAWLEQGDSAPNPVRPVASTTAPDRGGTKFRDLIEAGV